MATGEATRICQFITDNHALFLLWSKENLLNHQKVSKYCKKDCMQNICWVLMSLLTALVVRNSHILEIILFFKKTFYTKLKKCSISNWKRSRKRSEKRKVERSLKQLSNKINFSAFLQISRSNFRLKLLEKS